MIYYDEIAEGYEELHREEQEKKIACIQKELLSLGWKIGKKETVLDTMVYFGQLKGLRRKEAKEWAEKYLERVELIDSAGQVLGKLSGGQQQKVQLGVTIMNDPKLLILDEPTKGFDPVNRRLMMDIIQELVETCEEDYYTENYCSLEGYVAKDLHDFSCLIDGCSENVLQEIVEECNYGCGDGECLLECYSDSECEEDYFSDEYCFEDNSYHEVHDFSCGAEGNCEENIGLVINRKLGNSVPYPPPRKPSPCGKGGFSKPGDDNRPYGYYRSAGPPPKKNKTTWFPRRLNSREIVR